MLFISLLGGFLLLLLGGDLLVRGAVGVAKRFNVSPLLIGLTLVGFGTSTPELVTSLQAAAINSPGIAVGNVVGSNIANILLILGAAALIRPIAVDPAALRRDGGMLVIATAACAVAVLAGTLSRPAGGIFVAALIAYIVFTYMRERRQPDASAELHAHEAEAVTPPTNLPLAIGLTVAGLAMTIFGARLLVDGAVELARGFGISETIIGLTIVAVGTSLPELITSTMAAWRRQGDVALGNVIGSNIYNVLGILGITALVLPVPIPPEIARFDLWVMIAVTALLLLFAFTGRRLSRIEGAVLAGGYAAYLVALGSGITSA
ncbi:calcium/sodium antiporter [Indioceanicola profundi]|uniref:calcium/sodium antiporter n=1 Tax=Indioceanicola profundi TaxID=2220096 RepID=UPI000E6A9B96|nr:calcium/sodium antiporter [Indioceanicola profundi]